MSTTENPHYLTSDEVAKELRTSRLVIDRAARAGRISSIKLGRRRLFTRDDVAQYVDGLRREARR